MNPFRVKGGKGCTQKPEKGDKNFCQKRLPRCNLIFVSDFDMQ